MTLPIMPNYDTVALIGDIAIGSRQVCKGRCSSV